MDAHPPTAALILETQRPADPVSPRPARILFVHDDPAWVHSVESVLSARGFVVVPARSMEEMLAEVRTLPPDLVVVNESLGDATGVEICGRLQESGRLPATTPILMVAPRPLRREERLEALRAGAWDFYTLPMDPEELLLRLDVLVRAGRERE